MSTSSQKTCNIFQQQRQFSDTDLVCRTVSSTVDEVVLLIALGAQEKQGGIGKMQLSGNFQLVAKAFPVLFRAVHLWLCLKRRMMRLAWVYSSATSSVVLSKKSPLHFQLVNPGKKTSQQ